MEEYSPIVPLAAYEKYVDGETLGRILVEKSRKLRNLHGAHVNPAYHAELGADGIILIRAQKQS